MTFTKKIELLASSSEVLWEGVGGFNLPQSYLIKVDIFITDASFPLINIIKPKFSHALAPKTVVLLPNTSKVVFDFSAE